jgi:hypothetical protein
MSLDDELMRNQTEKVNDPAGSSAERVGAIRQEQRDGGNSDNPQVPDDLRSSKMAAMRTKASKSKNKLSIEQKSLSATTSKFLQSAWKNIIMSFGFSFLYVYVHLFLQQIFGKIFFAPLGSEWRDRPGLTMTEREKKGEPFKVIESFGTGCLTLVLFIVVIFIFAIISLIVEVVTNPLRTGLKIVLEGIWSFLGGGH